MRLGIVLELAVVLCGVTGNAHAAETKRIRASVDALPRQDAPIQVAAHDAVLPDGAREGSAVPKSWNVAVTGTPHEAGHCTDGRRASVKTAIGGDTFTAKIWEANGKAFVDRAHVEIANGTVHVVSAERAPVAPIGEDIWAYRRGAQAVLVFARDVGSMGRSTFFECLVDDRSLAIAGGTTSFDSSPDDATGVRADMFEAAGIARKPGPWAGVAYTAIASVTKASADSSSILSIVVKKP